MRIQPEFSASKTRPAAYHGVVQGEEKLVPITSNSSEKDYQLEVIIFSLPFLNWVIFLHSNEKKK